MPCRATSLMLHGFSRDAFQLPLGEQTIVTMTRHTPIHQIGWASYTDMYTDNLSHNAENELTNETDLRWVDMLSGI